MGRIPIEVVSARLVDRSTGTSEQLKTRQNSGCHFVDRISHGEYEVGFRIDWTDLDVNGDPTLDADLFLPGDTKAIRSFKEMTAHHTRKSQDGTSEWAYRFEHEDLKLEFDLVVTRELKMTIDGIIVGAPEQ